MAFVPFTIAAHASLMAAAFAAGATHEAQLASPEASTARPLVLAVLADNDAEPAAPRASAEPLPLGGADGGVQADVPDASTEASNDDGAIADPRVDSDGPSEIGPSAIGPIAFADLSDEEVAEKVAAYLDGLTTMEAQFVQVAPSGGVSEGELWLRRPRQLRMEYAGEKEAQLVIVATQGNVYVRDNDLDTTDFYPIDKTPLRFILTSDLSAEKLDLVDVFREPGRVSVTLVDPAGEAEGELTLTFAAPTLQLTEWSVVDPQGGLTVVALRGVQEGGDVSNRLFRVPDAGGEFLNR
ncbi:MAG: hypothetical protein GC152_01540 [Alphaproteobacteria bacterium]|nr:hypothetical protein [Alphaproteobacteria bacterium]